MPDCAELRQSAQANPASVRFVDLCTLAECFGWTFVRSRGSHYIYKRVGTMQLMNFQDHRGRAKPYQVRQLLAAIEALHDD